MRKLKIAFIWHMHQPLYKDRLTGNYLMPWVRLHAIKDYLDMVAILGDYPAIRQTFNLVPSLLEQLVDYASGAVDRALLISLKPAEELNVEEKCYILERFFDLTENQRNRFSAYAELAAQRNHWIRKLPAAQCGEHFSLQQYTDLVVLYNLAWFDPRWIREDVELSELYERGQGFTWADQQLVIHKQQSLIRRIIPTYREMAHQGKIELTTSAFYHPILPLLYDSDIAKSSRPGTPLPSRFAHPDDAVRQVQKGIRYFEEQFGFRPKGFWPSEQSVSEGVVEILSKEGLEWLVSDEGILAGSLGHRLERDCYGNLLDPAQLYQPYWMEKGDRRIALLFRDLVLSDLIGFSYSRMGGFQAARDLVERLQSSLERLPDDRDYLVTIALDGENCWEHYPQDGEEFLHSLYRLVSEHPLLEMTTVSDYLASNPPQKQLERLHPGSWIYSDFNTWIGDPVKNRAWDYLGRVRQELLGWEGGQHTPDLERAWEEIAIAEGSDWFWWFGDGHSSGQDEAFDLQFRLHLQNVYTLMGHPIPDFLLNPVATGSMAKVMVPKLPIRPRLDGRSGEGWGHAGLFDPASNQGAMHQNLRFVQKLRYGFDNHHLYLRVEFAPFYSRQLYDELAIYVCYPGQTRFNSPVNFRAGESELGFVKEYLFAHEIRVGWNPPGAILSVAREYHTWDQQETSLRMAYDQALEIAIPFSRLGVPQGQEMQFVVVFARNGVILEALPLESPLGLAVPISRILAKT